MTGDPVRIVWNADGTRRVVRSDQARPDGDGPPSPRRFHPGRALPLLALLVLLGVIGGVWAWLARPSPPAAQVAQTTQKVQTAQGAQVAQVSPPVTLVPTACCEVRFTVRGQRGVPVRLSVVSAPSGATVKAGQTVGRAPGVIRLPVPGTYTLRVTAQGYAPGTVTIKTPTNVPVQVALTP